MILPRTFLRMLLSDLFCEWLMVISNILMACEILFQHTTAVNNSPTLNHLASVPVSILFGPLVVVALCQAIGLIFRNREFRCGGAAICCLLWLWLSTSSLWLGTTASALSLPLTLLAARALALLYLPRGLCNEADL